MNTGVLPEVREYTEEYDVELILKHGRLCVKALNEGGFNCTVVDLCDLLKAVKRLTNNQSLDEIIASLDKVSGEWSVIDGDEEEDDD